ncbi:MAG: hypothetical protein IKJ45_07645 [Kiritimatiellae bacterium]|nr:hypothetical protein [Kiritimatiellia bacterium]
MNTKMKVLFFVMSGIGVCFADAAEIANSHQAYIAQYGQEHLPLGMDANYWYDFEALFFDLDENGMEEALIASKESRDRSGNGWAVTRRNATTGKIEEHPMVNESGFTIHSYPWALYVVSLAGVRDRLYGNDVTVYDIKNFGTRNDKQNIYRDDVLLKMDTNGLLRATSVANGFFDLVSNPGFRRLDRAVTEFYRGEDAVLVERAKTAVNIPCTQPRGFELFANKYREEMKRRFGVTHSVTVYAVFFDADNDGDVDFYVSSDVEERQKGQYEWHLYLNDGGKFVKAEKTVWFNVGKDYNRESIDPDETAPMNSFYSVQRMNGFAPSIIILDRDGNTFHSRTSLRQRLSQPPVRQARRLPYEQEREYYHALEEWQGCQKSKLGFIPAYDFEEFMVWFDFLRLERLECKSFPEK